MRTINQLVEDGQPQPWEIARNVLGCTYEKSARTINQIVEAGQPRPWENSRNVLGCNKELGEECQPS